MYNINLAPWRERRFKKNILFAILINLIVWTICVLGYASYQNQLQLPEKQKTIRELEHQIQLTKKNISGLKTLNQTKIMFDKLRETNTALLDSLVQLSKIIPANVQLNSISITPEEMVLIGQATNQRDMTAFSQKVFNLVYFNRQKSWTISEKATDVNFKLVLKHENENTSSL